MGQGTTEQTGVQDDRTLASTGISFYCNNTFKLVTSIHGARDPAEVYAQECREQ